jgi:hypothetical protein
MSEKSTATPQQPAEMPTSYSRILKYPLDVYDAPGPREIEVNAISIVPLSVAEQRGELMLWANVTQSTDESKNKPLALAVDVIGTGHPILDGTLLYKTFVGSVVMTSTPFVWHVCAQLKEEK